MRGAALYPSSYESFSAHSRSAVSISPPQRDIERAFVTERDRARARDRRSSRRRACRTRGCVGSNMPSTRAAPCSRTSAEHRFDLVAAIDLRDVRRRVRARASPAVLLRGRYAANSRPGRGDEQRHHVAEFQRCLRRMARFHPVHDGRPLIAPHRDADRLIEPVAQFGERDARELHAIDAREPREPHLQREAAELVAARHRVLRRRRRAAENSPDSDAPSPGSCRRAARDRAASSRAVRGSARRAVESRLRSTGCRSAAFLRRRRRRRRRSSGRRFRRRGEREIART